MRRINVSLDSLRADRFAHVTRGGDLAAVLRGIDAGARAGLAVKFNMVALTGINEDETADMLRWCGQQGFDLTLIETMPLGAVEEDRTDPARARRQGRSRMAGGRGASPRAHR